MVCDLSCKSYRVLYMTQTSEATVDTTKLQKHWTGQHSLENCGRAIAKALGFKGQPGGWIYDPAGKPFVQGYQSLALHFGAKYVKPEVTPGAKWGDANYFATQGYYFLPDEKIASIVRTAAQWEQRTEKREAKLTYNATYEYEGRNVKITPGAKIRRNIPGARAGDVFVSVTVLDGVLTGHSFDANIYRLRQINQEAK
jgi:hypothetical protein